MRNKFVIFCLLVACVMFTGCFGNTSVGNEIIAQPKKLIQRTPMICPDQHVLDVSLGVMRHGVGSMSTSDMLLAMSPEKDSLINAAIQTGALVRIKYDERRLKICAEDALITSIEIVKDSI